MLIFRHIDPRRDEIEASASRFRQEHAPGQLGPLLVEQILDRIGVEIVPVRGLRRRRKLDGYVCNAGTRICVDLVIFRDQAEEYRVLLGHETAHIARHKAFIPTFSSIEECKVFHNQLAPQTRSFLETDAMEWAGRILVPRGQLKTLFEEIVARWHPLYVESFGAEPAHKIFGNFVVDQVARGFGVVASLAERRIREDGLWSWMSRITKETDRKLREDAS